MANAKSRLKAPKSATNKRGRDNSKQSLTGVKEIPDLSGNNAAGTSSVMGQINKINPINLNDKAQLLDQTECVTKNNNAEKQSPRSLRHCKRSSTKKSSRSKEINQRKPQIVMKSGKIKKNSKGDLKLIDNILKSELMIDRDKPKDSVYPLPINNNNQIGISNQNDSTISDTFANEVSNVNEISESDLRAENNFLSENNFDDPKESDSKGSKQKVVKKAKVNDNSSTKTKQVTLSNGLVLTLSLFQCDYCKKMFSSKSSMRRHIYAHTKVKPHTCKNCSRKFRYKAHLRNHMAKFHRKEKVEYPCQICDKTFMLEENLSLHLASHIKNENAYNCIYCGKKFSYHLLLIQHEKQHLVTGRYQCTKCTMSYDCRNQLTSHVKSHSDIKDHICQYCGKEFLRMNSLKRHVQICHGGHRIQCPICKKNLKGHLTEHMRTHKQARPHECDVCGQCFTQSTQLTVHMRCHTGSRPYICRICNRPFTHSNALMLHIRRHTGEKPFQCAMCILSFSQLPHMKAHMRNIHKKMNPYRCTKCNQFFKLKSQLDTHSKTCTVGDKESSFEEKIPDSVQYEEVEVESVMTLSRMRYLLALLFTMIATKDRLKLLGFNKRLVDDLLVESLEAMGQKISKKAMTPLNRLKSNIQLLLDKTVPKAQMERFEIEEKSTEDILVLLTSEEKKN